MTLLIVEHIITGYGKKQVLFDVSFEMQKGEIVLLIGSNGSGKSTLIKTIYGLLKPWNNEAKIWFNGSTITNCKPFQLIKKGIVYVPQQNELFEDLTVKENLELSGMQTISKQVLKEKINIVVEQVPTLKTILKLGCARLSGGERKVVSLAMALVNQPKLIMLDEPLASISMGNTDTIIEHINNLRNSGISLIIVEHRLEGVFALADRVIGLRLGRLFSENISTIEEGTKKVMI